MPFELLMLLGFLGTVLLTLLPAAPVKAAGECFRGCRWRGGEKRRRVARHGGAFRELTRDRGVSRRRGAGHAAA